MQEAIDGVTVTVAETVVPNISAVIVVVPAATAVNVPSEIVTIPVFKEVQSADTVTELYLLGQPVSVPLLRKIDADIVGADAVSPTIRLYDVELLDTVLADTEPDKTVVDTFDDPSIAVVDDALLLLYPNS
ncbi:MAG: hypothetical protein LUC32_01700 [Clostridiales bacterium]|nr:hypothetical protein [Clostridiales bacterium]